MQTPSLPGIKETCDEYGVRSLTDGKRQLSAVTVAERFAARCALESGAPWIPDGTAAEPHRSRRNELRGSQ